MLNNDVQNGAFPDYLKWLRYFLDFCEKYQITVDEPERTRQFQSFPWER
ncbi:MAG TPA: hypothetical protein VFF53_05860 [Geobacteraceae bacterium]|nr:hypothetical protein [Geobacteraceae bacterium]